MSTRPGYTNKYKKYTTDLRRYVEKPVARATLAVSLTLVMTGAFLAFALRPTFVKISELNREIEESESTLASLKTKNQGMQRVASLWKEAEQYMPYLDQGVPVAPDYRTFVKEVEVLAIRNNVGIAYSSVGPSLVSSQVLKPYENKTNMEGVELPLSLQVNGSYEEVSKFIEELSMLDRVVAINALTVAPREEERGSEVSVEGEIGVQVTGVAYYFGDIKQLESVLGGKKK